MTFPYLDAVAWGAISAIATVLAVIVALFKEDLVHLWRRPDLVVSLRLAAPNCHKTKITFQNPTTGQILGMADCYYFRIWVENKERQRAEKVQVFASRLLKKHADGTFQEEKSFLPMNLRWAHSRPVEIFADGISRDMGKHCYLGHIYGPKVQAELGMSATPLPSRGIKEDRATVFALDLEVQPNTGSHLLRPGTYQLELRVAAANASPVKKLFEITITGKWFTEEPTLFSEGIGIKDVS
jgi:hypothetical protein